MNHPDKNKDIPVIADEPGFLERRASLARWMGRCFLAFLSLILPGAVSAADVGIALVEKGVPSNYSIVFANSGTDATEPAAAAKTLADVIFKATGSQLAVVPESGFVNAKPAIFVGMTKAAMSAGLDLKSVKGWNCLIQEKNKSLYLVGFDGRQTKNDEDDSSSYQGSLKAVTLFLEEFLNVRWLMPGPDGVDIPSGQRLEIPKDLKREWHPPFEYVIGRKTGDPVYSVANNFLGVSVFKSSGGHSYYKAVPADTYGKTHPEYFALIGGKRDSEGNHLCVSNKEVQQLMVDELLRQYDAGYDWAELGQEDAFRPCECDQCKAISQDPSERLWIVHRQLAERAKELRPGKKVVIIAYGPTKNPPKSFNSFPDNVVVQLSHYTPEDFAAWQPFNVEKTVYVYNWGDYHVPGYGPKRTPEYAYDQIKRFQEAGVKGIYLCGSFENVGLEGPVYYVYGRLLGNPSLDWKAICEEYYSRCFREAKAPMTQFYQKMYARLELWNKMNRPNFKTEQSLGADFNTPEDFYSEFFPPDLLLSMKGNFSRAQKMARDPIVTSRLRRVEPDFDNVATIATVFHLFRAYRLSPSPSAFEALGNAVAQRKAFVDKWFPSGGKPDLLEGWVRIFGNCTKEEFVAGGRLNAILRAPFNWDFDRLKALKILPGTAGTPLPINRVNDIKVDGVLNESAWSSVEQKNLSEINLGEPKNAAKFGFAYDDDALYLSLDCASPPVDPNNAIQGEKTARDIVRLILDPTAQRLQYFEFVFSPVNRAKQSSRFGFVEDEVDPMYGKLDTSWKADWQWAEKTDTVTGHWSAEARIPFSTLGVATPRKGEVWLGNLGRLVQASPVDGKKRPPEKTLWSPNLVNKEFDEPSAFGELVFQ